MGYEISNEEKYIMRHFYEELFEYFSDTRHLHKQGLYGKGLEGPALCDK